MHHCEGHTNNPFSQPSKNHKFYLYVDTMDKRQGDGVVMSEAPLTWLRPPSIVNEGYLTNSEVTNREGEDGRAATVLISTS